VDRLWEGDESRDVDYTDAIGAAKKYGKTEAASLLERFNSDATKTKHAMRVEIGWYDEAAAEMFALVVFVSDGLPQVNFTTTSTPAAKFFSITKRLPLELQMVLCHCAVGSGKDHLRERQRGGLQVTGRAPSVVLIHPLASPYSSLPYGDPLPFLAVSVFSFPCFVGYSFKSTRKRKEIHGNTKARVLSATCEKPKNTDGVGEPSAGKRGGWGSYMEALHRQIHEGSLAVFPLDNLPS